MTDIAMNKYTVTDLVSCLSNLFYEVKGNTANKYVSHLSQPNAANEEALIWISNSRNDKEELVFTSKAKVIICGDGFKTELFPDRCFIVAHNPKLTFLRIANTYFKSRLPYQIHPTAIIHPQAEIDKDVYIGPHTYIGKCKINSGVVIHGLCYIYDNVQVGKNVILQAGCKIGGDGLGYVINEQGNLENFPHVGGVILEEGVELGSNCAVFQGSLSSTIIKKHTKVDGNVVIEHNVVIGENTIIAGNSMIAGSSRIGDWVFMGPNVTVIDYIQVGDRAHLGAGSVIMENVKEGAKVVARPPLTLPENIRSTYTAS